MNKLIVVLSIISVVIIGVILGIYVYFNSVSRESEKIGEMELAQIDNEDNSKDIESEIEDIINVINTTSEEERVSPNAIITLKTKYNGCEHSLIDMYTVDDKLVNMTESEVKDIYFDYNIELFEPDEINLIKEVNGICAEHYIIKNVDGFLEIYRKIENGEEVLYEKTEIAIEYLPEADQIQIQNGLIIEGKDKLKSILEDYGS